MRVRSKKIKAMGSQAIQIITEATQAGAIVRHLKRGKTNAEWEITIEPKQPAEQQGEFAALTTNQPNTKGER